ncbi:MAG: pyridoxal phosphate-dependent aminotransferase [Lachnospiraceae bacterium]|nr:pyridoxal phosphate-dependent aminotransferase [Lachnospiraceae bacterium]
MVISKNMEKLVAGSSTIRKLFEEGIQMAAEVGADNVYDFSLGNPASPVPQEVRDSIEDILDNTDGNLVHGYMKNAGYDEVRKAVADSLNRKNGTSYTLEDIIMTCGAAGAMNCVFRSLLALDDEVITFAPFFGEYRSYVANYGGNLVVVPADTETFQLNLDALRPLINEKTKCVIINNPNNPSGVIYTEETLRKLNDILVEAEKEIGHPIYVLADEPYRELVYGGQTVPYIPNIIKNSIFLYSFSKTLSLPGERIGYMAVSKDIDYYDEMISALVVANRCLGYINAPSLFQLVVARCLDIPANLEFYDRNRKLLYDELTRLGFSVVHPDGAFYMLIKSPVPEEDDFVVIGKKYHIILVPAKSFGCPGYVRLAYCVSHDMIKRSLPAFEKLAHEYFDK